MTRPTLDGISSGTPYRVTRTDGQRPTSAADFVGERAFLIHQADRSVLIDGVGRPDTYGTGVQFSETDLTEEGRDARRWHLRSLPDQQLIAQRVASG